MFLPPELGRVIQYVQYVLALHRFLSQMFNILLLLPSTYIVLSYIVPIVPVVVVVTILDLDPNGSSRSSPEQSSVLRPISWFDRTDSTNLPTAGIAVICPIIIFLPILSLVISFPSTP